MSHHPQGVLLEPRPAGVWGAIPRPNKQRHAAECGINLLKQQRGVETRFDKLAVRYEVTIHIATSDIWLRALERSL